MVITIIVGNTIKHKTLSNKFNIEDFLRENARSVIEGSEEILVHNVSVNSDPVYKFGEGSRVIVSTIQYSPLEEISIGTYVIKGDEQTATVSHILDSKQGWVLKQYILKKFKE